MRARYDEEGVGHLMLSKPEIDHLPHEALRRIKAYSENVIGLNGGSRDYSFYGSSSMNLAIEICRFHHLTMESVLDAVP